MTKRLFSSFHRSLLCAPLYMSAALSSVVASPALCTAPSPAAAHTALPSAKLGVLLIFDQLRAADVDRLDPLFGAGGFGGIRAQGAQLDAWYPYANTETGPGHATLATGASPRIHGICCNGWYDAGKPHYVVEDPRYKVIGLENKTGRGPAALQVGTLGDAMKLDSNGKARVVTLSLKDRAAILTGGQLADVAAWYEADLGRFTTTTAYGDTLPVWLQDLSAQRLERSFTEGTWSPLPHSSEYQSLIPDDTLAGEGTFDGWTVQFPHDLKTLTPAQRNKAYRATPQSMADLFAFAKAAVVQEHLGQDAVPDLLVISVSTTDYVGHVFGPTSLEEVDMLRRADQEVRSLIAFLNDTVGTGQFALMISSDHGSTMPPELPQSQGHSATRISLADLTAKAKAAVQAVLSTPTAPLSQPKKKAATSNEAPVVVSAVNPADRVLGFFVPNLFLNLDGLSLEQQESVLRAVQTVLQETKGIAHVYRVDHLDKDTDPFTPFVKETCFTGRCGALYIRQEPRAVFVEKDENTGTDHGAPYVHDRRVPLFVMGPTVKRGRFSTPVDIRDIAPTMAFLLHTSPPDAAQGKPIYVVGDKTTGF